MNPTATTEPEPKTDNETELRDLLSRVVELAKHHHATGKKGKDAINSTRVLDMFSDLYLGLDHQYGLR